MSHGRLGVRLEGHVNLRCTVGEVTPPNEKRLDVIINCEGDNSTLNVI